MRANQRVSIGIFGVVSVHSTTFQTENDFFLLLLNYISNVKSSYHFTIDHNSKKFGLNVQWNGLIQISCTREDNCIIFPTNLQAVVGKPFIEIT